jgi:hypothetical protein
LWLIFKNSAHKKKPNCCTPFCLQLCLSPLISPTKQVHSALLFSVSFSGLFMGPTAATLRFLLSRCVHSVLGWQVAPLHSVRVVFVACSCYFPILSLFSCCCTSRLVEVYTAFDLKILHLWLLSVIFTSHLLFPEYIRYYSAVL